MDRPVTISVIAPVYGVEKYIVEFADSVFSQSYPHLQFVFVNDGTKDNSIKVLEDLIESRYQHLKDRIVIVNKENGGLPAARVTGLEHATGDYVYHVDPDDWISPGSLEKIAAKAQETKADIIYFHYVKEYESRSSVKREGFYDASLKDKYVRNMYNHRAFGTLCNKCIRRGLYQENTIHSPKYSYAEDCYVTTQLVGYAKHIEHLDEVVYHYRKNNPTSITRQGRKRRKNEYAMNFLDLYEKYSDVPYEKNPVAPVFDDILIQAGWYSLFYGLDLFTKYPYLAKAVRKARIRCGSDVWIPAQILVKICALFR